jgi:putative transposase
MEQAKFRGKYRIASARLPGWDYATAAAYFVTVCTGDRHPFFGHVANRVMHRSALGQMAGDIWDLIPSQFPHCTLDAFVVMPDHIHGILVIGDEGRDAINRVSTLITDEPSQPIPGGVTQHHNPMLSPHSLSRVMRWYKGRCTHDMRALRPDFGWQSRFYDRIIRDEKALQAVRHYIDTNPAR